MALSSAYFFIDFLSLAYLGILDCGMAIHHSICILGMAGVVVTNKDAYYLVIAMFWSEMSDPFLDAKIILRHLGLRYSKSYEIVEMFQFGKLSLVILCFSNLHFGKRIAWLASFFQYTLL